MQKVTEYQPEGKQNDCTRTSQVYILKQVNWTFSFLMIELGNKLKNAEIIGIKLFEHSWLTTVNTL